MRELPPKPLPSVASGLGKESGEGVGAGCRSSAPLGEARAIEVESLGAFGIEIVTSKSKVFSLSLA